MIPFSESEYLAALGKLLTFSTLLLAPALLWISRSDDDESEALSKAFLGAGLTAWLLLIGTYFYPGLQRVGVLIPICLSLIALIRARGLGSCSAFRAVVALFAVQVLASILVLSAGYLYGGISRPLSVAAYRWFYWAADNELPYDFVQTLWNHSLSTSTRAVLFERTPVQAGFVNLFAPLVTSPLDYQMLGVCLQSSALQGTYLLLRSIGISRRLALGTVALVGTCGFFLMNAFYVWPKLFSAGYILAAVALLLRGKGRGILFGAMAGLGMLIHAGALIPIVASCIWALKAKPWRYLVSSGVTLLTLLAPWILFIRCVQPPGDGQAKWHLAGIILKDDRSLLVTIWDSYRSLSLGQILTNKLYNVGVQFVDLRLMAEIWNAPAFYPKLWWDLQFVVLVWACMPWLIGLAWLLFVKRQGAFLGSLPVLGLLTTLVTCVMMFGPALDQDPSSANAFPLLPQQSYYLPMLLIGVSIASTAFLGAWPKRIIFCGHIAFASWIYFLAPSDVLGISWDRTPAPAALSVALVSSSILFLVGWRGLNSVGLEGRVISLGPYNTAKRCVSVGH